MANVKLGTKAVGSIVKIKVNGASKDFIVVQQGNPNTSTYDSSCAGTWLLMKDIYTTSTFGNNNSYKDSSIHTYLNGTFYNLIDSNIRAAIKQVKIPYQNGTGSSGFFGDDRTVDTHIKMLRNSLGKYRTFIVTLRGMGYKFEPQT